MYGRCSVCDKEGVLSEHHILKRAVFGNNDKTGIVCVSCHRDIDRLVKVFENEILQKFEACYKIIWNTYSRYGYISKSRLKYLVKSQFRKIKVYSYVSKKKRELNSEDQLKDGDNDQLSEDDRRFARRKKRYRNLSSQQIGTLRKRQCPICKKQAILTIHHIKKKAVFGPTDCIGFPCNDCHVKIEQSVKFFEAQILRKFEKCYESIWNVYCHEGCIPEEKIRELARKQLLLIKDELNGVDRRYEKRIQKLSGVKNGIYVTITPHEERVRNF